VIPEILKSAELISKIFYASKEQLASISSINNAIIQFSETTNQNSATAEEMASSAEELTAQAEQLKDIIAVFKIRKTEENGKNI
jgi:methyl-accepting chemotaxis protein